MQGGISSTIYVLKYLLHPVDSISVIALTEKTDLKLGEIYKFKSRQDFSVELQLSLSYIIRY